jgi:hypothetical protein
MPPIWCVRLKFCTWLRTRCTLNLDSHYPAKGWEISIIHIPGLRILRSILLAGIVTLLLGFALDKPATAALAANETPTSDPEDTLSNVLGYFQADVPPATDGVLPDLQNLPPADLRLVYSLGKKYLRFSISIWNAGLGILE